MALIVEDGSIVPGANSYVSVDDIRTYAEDRGIAFSDDDEVLEGSALQAMDYIEAEDFKGCRVSCDQPLSFPREGVWVDGCELPSDSIPTLLKNAQCQLAVEVSNGLNLDATVLEPGIKRKKVDVLEKEYFGGTSGAASTQPILTKVSKLLAPLTQAGSGVRTVRI